MLIITPLKPPAAELVRLNRENARLEEEVAFLKKAAAYFAKMPMKYAMIKGDEDHFPVGMMCRIRSVSRSGYYSWKNRPLSGRDQANQKRGAEIKRVFDDEKDWLGSPRISRRLQEEGKPTVKKRLHGIKGADLNRNPFMVRHHERLNFGCSATYGFNP